VAGPPLGDSNLRTRTFERILLIKPSSLGDVVHALPVLHGLRTRYPQAKIDWLIASPFAPLVEGHPELDETVVFDRSRYGRVGRSATVTGEFVRFVRELRARAYDLTVDLQGLFRTGFLSWACGAPVRVGLRHSREAAWLFYTHRAGTDDPDLHAVDRNYAVAGLLDFESVPVEFHLAPSGTVCDEARELLRTRGLGDGESPVVIAPGARWETKVWSADRFAAAIEELHALGHRCVLVGSIEESALCERISLSCRSRPVNLAGETPVRLLPAVIGQAGLVIAHDSAVMHLAVALSRPLVCIVGPTNPLRTGPYQRLTDVVRLELDCAPCYLRRLAQCPHGHRCMKELGVGEVVAASERALNALAP